MTPIALREQDCQGQCSEAVIVQEDGNQVDLIGATHYVKRLNYCKREVTCKEHAHEG